MERRNYRRPSLVAACALVAFACAPWSGAGAAQSQIGVPPPAAQPAPPPATAGAAPAATAEPSFNLFYDQGDYLRELLAQGNTTEAAAAYERYAAFFAAEDKRTKYQSDLAGLAERLNADQQPRLAAATAALGGQAWPTARAGWPGVRQALDQARAAVAAYDKVALLRDPAFHLAQADEVRAAADRLAAGVVADAPAQFAAFDPFGDTGFFAIYPAPLAAPSFLDQQWPGLAPKLRAADTGKLARFLANYPKETLSPAALAQLTQLYGAAIARDSGSADLKTTLQAYSAARAAGFDTKGMGGIKVGFVEVTSKTMLREHQIDFPAEVDVDLPVDVVTESLEDALTKPTSEAGDYIVIFDVSMAKAERRVRDTTKNKSKTVVGTHKEPNPAWDSARIDLNQAQIDANRLGSGGGGGSTPAAVLLGALVQAAAGAHHQSRLDDSKAKLLATPRYVDVPDTTDYQWSKAVVDGRKTMTVNYYVIDRRKGRYIKSIFDVHQEQRFMVAYNVDSNDINAAELKKELNTDQDVNDWEHAAATVKLSQIMDHYNRQAAASLPLPTATVLREQMMKDKNTALARVQAETFDDRPVNDPRFDSVVAIYTANALGSGFYVRPDIVLTNYHVVEKSTFVEMKRFDKTETFGSVIAKDVRLDLALVKVQDRGRPVEFYTANTLPSGSTVDAIGHPKGHLFSISRGIVSAVRKEKSDFDEGGREKVLYIQTDAAVNPGNSGGPLFQGNKVVGVNTWIVGQASAGLNFSVHYSEVLKFINENMNGG